DPCFDDGTPIVVECAPVAAQHRQHGRRGFGGGEMRAARGDVFGGFVLGDPGVAVVAAGLTQPVVVTTRADRAGVAAGAFETAFHTRQTRDRVYCGAVVVEREPATRLVRVVALLE